MDEFDCEEGVLLSADQNLLQEFVFEDVVFWLENKTNRPGSGGSYVR